VFSVRYEHHLYIKKKSYLRHRTWRPIDVFPVTYESLLHIKSKAISVTGRGDHRRVSCEVQTSCIYKNVKLTL
jgi:hypothetical protein